MSAKKKRKEKAEFGDWQTPIELAREVCMLLSRKGLEPASILEPTCGRGSFLIAALESFPTVKEAVGIDINQNHIKAAAESIFEIHSTTTVRFIHKDFFSVDWEKVVSSLSVPILVVGNFPWVTNSELMSLGSSNLPKKNNFHNYRGIDAIMGKSNFDISEWMLMQAVEWIKDCKGTIAMLCKTTVSRKILKRIWQNKYHLKECSIYKIDAFEHFGASVDACLFVISISPGLQSINCEVYDSLKQKIPSTTISYQQKRLIADAKLFAQYGHLLNEAKPMFNWRSGIKHDCSKVMELRKTEGLYCNGLGEFVELEGEFLYPMLKSSDLANGRNRAPHKRMLVTQRVIGENTRQMQHIAPKTWNYLHEHAELLDRRASSIYRNRPRFSIFGVGDYSFALWKVAISAFYKSLEFRVIGPVEQKPVVFDDTCYFIGCGSEAEANCLAKLLNSKTANDFFRSFIFWDAKRPITIALLNSLDLLALAEELGQTAILSQYCPSHTGTAQLSLFK